jgi:hypothetical protein
MHFGYFKHMPRCIHSHTENDLCLAHQGGQELMKRRMKKAIINQPMGINNIEFDDFDADSYNLRQANAYDPKMHRFKNLKKDHNHSAALHQKHSHKKV